MDVEVALQRCGGAARWSALRELGVTRHALRAAVSGGRAEWVSHGAYAAPGADPALVAAAILNGVVSHASAARLHGLDLYHRPRLVEVTVARGARQRSPGVRVYACDLAAGEREHPAPITTVRRTLRDCARTMPLLSGVVLLDGAVRAKVITTRNLNDMARAATGPGSMRLRRAVAHVDAVAGSPIETALRLFLVLLDVEVETQVWIRGVGYVDFVLDGWLALEPDGYEFHSGRGSYRNDRRRGNLLVERGMTLLRFSWEDIRLRPFRVLEQIARVLEQRPDTGAAIRNS